MPACTGESISKIWNHRDGSDARPGSETTSNGSATSMSPASPASPSRSPPTTSPMPSMRRIRQECSNAKVPFRRAQSASSAFALIQEPFLIKSDRRDSLAVQPTRRPQQPQRAADGDASDSFLVRLVGWYPLFLLRVVRVLLGSLTEVTIGRALLAVPTFWISLWAWLFWKVFHVPMMAVKGFLSFLCTPISDRFREKKSVLISGGSTIQSLKLARNFYSIGVRVVVCEVDDVFSLTRFSTAVSKFYTVPRPNGDDANAYVQALCDIVQKEDVSFYVPVCATSASHYDAVAKPYLELLGCTCYCPGVKESWMLDDVLELLRRCRVAGLATPRYHEVSSRDDVVRLYDAGALHAGRHVMHATGMSGVRERTKVVLPLARPELLAALPHEIDERRPWVIVQHVAGERFLTCTTVKGSHVVANVTCRVDGETGAVVPVENREIVAWLRDFFDKLRSLRPVTGHMSFRFIVASGGAILPVGCRVGVSLPYVCHTSAHARILCKPCRHFVRQLSGPLAVRNGAGGGVNEWLAKVTTPHAPFDVDTSFVGAMLDKREALFVYWDPLPYCAYYHMQLPFQNVLGFVQRGHRDRFARTLAAPVH